MKLFLTLLGFTLLSASVLLAQAPNYFGTPNGPQPPATPTAVRPVTPNPATSPAVTLAPTPPARILTEDDFRAFLVGTTWQWRGPGLDGGITLTFYADGTARNSYNWVAKFVIKNLTEIELRMGKGETAKMTFDKTYTHYDGIDFNKKRPLQGQREK